MAKYRSRLPQLGHKAFLTDGGLETTLVFLKGIDLPAFAAFDLLKDDVGVETLREYFIPYLEIAKRKKRGFILETPTWRANPDWARKIGYDIESMTRANQKSVDLMLELRQDYETVDAPLVISGNIGPRGDGYRPEAQMSATEARDYHALQVQTFAHSEADMVTAVTLNYVEEAIGIVKAAFDVAMPVVISFTLETDGRLPDGTSLGDAIHRTDAATNSYASYYMINCAHPTHFEHILKEGSGWRERVRGLRANASRRSHAELDASPDLDDGNPLELGDNYRDIMRVLPNLTVLGGCCGTDHRHIESIAETCC